jgi:hypothetical protein
VVAARRCNLLAVGAERDGANTPAMSKRGADRLPRSRIPQPGGAINASGYDSLSIGTKSNCPNFTIVPHSGPD